MTRISRTTTSRTTRTTTTTKPEPVPPRHPFALSLGANLGDAEAALASALETLRGPLGPLTVAPLYRTSPVGAADPQPDYLNTAAIGATRLAPGEILALVHELEAAAGRVRGDLNAPRELDVDLLLYGERVSDRPELTLPHPRMRERRFVLVPLAEIAPDWRVPPDGRTVAELLAATADRGRVEKVGWKA
jgi:2-amino-4-hydroxy-6-hydroxymethyldihydropteridine diphosphokinase